MQRAFYALLQNLDSIRTREELEELATVKGVNLQLAEIRRHLDSMAALLDRAEQAEGGSASRT